MYRISQILAKRAATIVFYHPHFVVADTIDVELTQKEAGIIDQELRDPVVPVCENLAARPCLIGEVQTVILVPFA